MGCLVERGEQAGRSSFQILWPGRRCALFLASPTPPRSFLDHFHREAGRARLPPSPAHPSGFWLQPDSSCSFQRLACHLSLCSVSGFFFAVPLGLSRWEGGEAEGRGRSSLLKWRLWPTRGKKGSSFPLSGQPDVNLSFLLLLFQKKKKEKSHGG